MTQLANSERDLAPSTSSTVPSGAVLCTIRCIGCSHLTGCEVSGRVMVTCGRGHYRMYGTHIDRLFPLKHLLQPDRELTRIAAECTDHEPSGCEVS